MRGTQCDDRLTTHAHSFDPAHPHTVGFFVSASLFPLDVKLNGPQRTFVMNRIAQFLVDTPPPVLGRWQIVVPAEPPATFAPIPAQLLAGLDDASRYQLITLYHRARRRQRRRCVARRSRSCSRRSNARARTRRLDEARWTARPHAC